MKRFGQIIKVKPEHFEEYKKYHAAVWPEVLEKIKECNIQNYSIFHKDGQLFAYMEYTGDDFDADYNSKGTIIQYNYSRNNNWFCGIMRKPINIDFTIRYNISQNER